MFFFKLNSMSLITTGNFLQYTVVGAVFHRGKELNYESKIKEGKVRCVLWYFTVLNVHWAITLPDAE